MNEFKSSLPQKKKHFYKFKFYFSAMTNLTQSMKLMTILTRTSLKVDYGHGRLASVESLTGCGQVWVRENWIEKKQFKYNKKEKGKNVRFNAFKRWTDRRLVKILKATETPIPSPWKNQDTWPKHDKPTTINELWRPNWLLPAQATERIRKVATLASIHCNDS